MIGSPVNLDLWRANSSLKNRKRWSMYTGDLFVVVKVCVETATYFLDELITKDYAPMYHEFSWTALLTF